MAAVGAGTAYIDPGHLSRQRHVIPCQTAYGNSDSSDELQTYFALRKLFNFFSEWRMQISILKGVLFVAELSGYDTGETLAWAVAEAIGEALDITELSVSITVLKLIYESGKEVHNYERFAPPNPLFINQGFEDAASPHSANYMRHRTYKNVGSAGIGAAGALASTATAVDVGGILQHSNAAGSTLAHLKNLRDVAKRYPHSRTIQYWLEVCMKCKIMKAGVRGGQLVTASIPVGPVGIASDVVAGLAKVGIAATMTGAVNRVAMQLHWRANVEMRLGSSLGGTADKPNGPASAAYFEIFRRRGATRIFGQYNVPALISEPGGWYPLRDKLLLI